MPIFTAINHRAIIAATNARPRPPGFTLIELLVVIFLIGLASAAVVINLPGGSSRLRDDAERMAARIAAARDNAVMGSKPMAIWFRTSGYGFEQRRGGQWTAAADKAFAQVNWTGGTQIAGFNGSNVINSAINSTANGTGSGAQQKQGRLTFDPSGLPSSPLAVQLRNDGSTLSVNVSAAGVISVEK